MKILLLSFLPIIFISVLPIHAQSAWKPHGYVQVTSKIILAEKRYDRSGEVVAADFTGDFTQSLWGLLQLNKRSDVILNLPFYKHNRRDPGQDVQTVRGMSDGEFGFCYKLYGTKQFTCHGTLNLGIPFGGPEQTDSVPFRDGDVHQSLLLSGKYTIQSLPLFISGGMGYRNRTIGHFTRGLSDNVLYYGRAGYSLKKLDLYFSA